MSKNVFLTVLLSVVMGLSVSAQKFKPSPVFLKGEKEINVLFDYSQVKFDGDSQEKYYKEKGGDWVDEWEGKRRENNAKSFLTSLNDELKKVDVDTGDYPQAQYTIIVEVLDCNFGTYAGPFSITAKVTCTLRIVKTGTTETLASITLRESQNSSTVIATPVDFDRIYLAFGEVGEALGDQLKKILK